LREYGWQAAGEEGHGADVDVWGEPDGGTAKTTAERHRQAEIRVRVSPVPYAREARELLRGQVTHAHPPRCAGYRCVTLVTITA
jgi:hypothetical protein